MKTPRTTIAGIVAGKLGSGPTVDLGREVAAYLLSENRIGELDSLLRDVAELRAAEGVVEVTAVCAYPLSDVVRRDIEVRLRGLYPAAKEFIINQQLDPEVVGGVQLELANQQLDLSIRAKLNMFKQLTADRS